MNPRPARLRLAAAIGFLVAAIVLFWGLGLLSAWITRGQLIHDARATLTALHDGQPLWQWRLRQPADLVAGRVFGNATVDGTPDGLRVTSQDGSPFELGLPLDRPVDARHWPLLRLDLHASGEGSLGMRYQTAEAHAACTAAEAARLGANDGQLTVDLRTADWRTAENAPCPPPGAIAYLLRLQARLPAGASLTLRSVALASASATAWPAAVRAEATDLALGLGNGAESFRAEGLAAPLLRLPAGATSETLLSLRDQARQHWPAAVILPPGQALRAGTDPPMPTWLDIGVCSAYLAWLLWLAWRQRPGVIRPWAEVAAIAAGPFWLIAGLRWAPHPSIPGLVAFVAALAYGGQSEWRRRPVAWSWWSRDWRDWLWPLVPLLVAGLLTLADGHGLLHLTPVHVLGYLAWALLQQWAMLALVMGRLRHTGLPAPVVILVTAALFGLLHTPNGALMQLCLSAELWWAWCFLRSPCLMPVALAHAASALLMESGLTGHLLRSLQVSTRFFL